MGHASLASKDYPAGPEDGRGELIADGRTWSFQHVSIGNPQCAIHVQDMTTLNALDLPSIGPAIEAHELFPNRTNVSWYTEVEPSRIRARIFERGVGETLSSGTGATGAAVANHLRGGPAHATVLLEGGELSVEVGEDLHVNLTGWARPVFAGRLSDEFVAELIDTDEGAA
jgi:diaminopimelate epimerase